MKYTLLELSQIIASSMDSDEFDSINDTTESLQIANVVRTCYFDLVNQGNYPEDLVLFNLTETSDATPTRMTLPTTIGSLKWLKYNIEDLTDTDQNWQIMRPLSLEDFLNRMHRLAESEDEVETYDLTIGSSTIPIMYLDDKYPEYYTTYDDNSVLFDSVDTDTEDFLRSTKTQGYGRKLQTFTMEDSFTAPLDDDQFALLLQESKSLAWAELKQTPHAKAEQSARRHKISQQMNKKAIKLYKAFDELPYFGRK
jgi:hypothetical protein